MFSIKLGPFVHTFWVYWWKGILFPLGSNDWELPATSTPRHRVVWEGFNERSAFHSKSLDFSRTLFFYLQVLWLSSASWVSWFVPSLVFNFQESPDLKPGGFHPETRDNDLYRPNWRKGTLSLCALRSCQWQTNSQRSAGHFRVFTWWNKRLTHTCLLRPWLRLCSWGHMNGWDFS